MKGGRDSTRLAHRTRYFATREGVQLLKDDNAHLPVTKKQQQYIRRLLRSFPEVLICSGMEHLDGLHRLCREGTNELLLEMPFYAWPESIWDTLYLLCGLRDMQIVLAHAERYPVENIEYLIREGVPLQLNAACLTKPLQRKRYRSRFFSCSAASVLRRRKDSTDSLCG